MLDKITRFFHQNIVEHANDSLNEHQLQLAVAALLVEVATIDDHLHQRELSTLLKTLETQFQLEHEELHELTQLAKEGSRESTSLYQFTQLINQECSPEDKFKVITGMWRMAYADGDLDKYEEHLIRKVADLIHVSHSHFIKAKKIALQE